MCIEAAENSMKIHIAYVVIYIKQQSSVDSVFFLKKLQNVSSKQELDWPGNFCGRKI